MLVLAAAAVVLAVLSVGTSLALADHVEEDRAYRDARPCAPADGEGRDRACLRSVPAVVRAVIDVGGRNSRHELQLTSAEFSYRSVPVNASGPLLGQVARGDTVSVTLWRDRVVEVRAVGRTEATRDTPYEDAVGAVVVIGLTVPLVPVSARLALWLVRHRRAVVADEVNALVYAWAPVDAGLSAAALASLVGSLAAPGLGFGAGLATRSVVVAVFAALAFAGGWAAARSLAPAMRRREAARTAGTGQ
ncbi:hypothetical protein [Streptodolium elevatio]